MDSATIIEVLDKLIGNTNACGDSSVDEERLNNLKTLIDITNWGLNKLYYNAHDRHSFEGSVRENGELSYSAILQINKWTKDVEESLS